MLQKLDWGLGKQLLGEGLTQQDRLGKLEAHVRNLELITLVVTLSVGFQVGLPVGHGRQKLEDDVGLACVGQLGVADVATVHGCARGDSKTALD